MDFSIRPASPADVPEIIDMLNEFAVFEKLEHYFEITETKLAAALFDDGAFVQCLVAETDGGLAAYAIMYPNFATFRGQKGIYLEDIYLRPAYRGTGLGAAMLKQIAKTAASQGCERIDFVVLDWNQPAIGFYEKHGAILDDQERRFKFIDDAFKQLST